MRKCVIKSIYNNIWSLITVALVTTVTLSIPQIGISVQSVGEARPYVYYLPLAIYNNQTTPLYNYTVELTLTPRYAPAFSQMRVNPFVTDLRFTPLYYWVMRANDNVFTIFIKVPYLPPKNFTYILIWYGYHTNIFPSYENPHKVFYYFDDYDNDSKIEPFYSGIFQRSTTPNYYTNGGLIENTTIVANGGSTEASLSETTTLPVNDSYIIGAGVKAVGGKDYPLFMYITYNYTYTILWWTYNIPIWDFIAVTNSNGQVNITLGNYNNGVQAVAPAELNNWYYFRLFVSPYSSYANVQDFNTGNSVVGWTALETSGMFKNHNVYFGFGQGVVQGQSLETNEVKFIYIRKIVLPEPLIYILPAHFYFTFS